MRVSTNIISFLTFVLFAHQMYAQDDLMNMIEEESEPATNYTIATFKSSRVINGHSVATIPGKHLDFRIHHRFGNINQGFVDLYGLDDAYVRIAFEYGLTDRWMIGAGRSSSPKNYDFFTKYKVLRQSTGANTMPVSVSYFTDATIDAFEWQRSIDETFARRLRYAHQVLVARKMNSKLSLQLSPSYVHRNLATNLEDPNDIFAMGMGGRYKVTNQITLNIEYYHLLNESATANFEHPLSIGVDIETGGHVFQLHLTNSRPMVAPYFISETQGNWGDGDIRFGFNISRMFSFKEGQGL